MPDSSFSCWILAQVCPQQSDVQYLLAHNFVHHNATEYTVYTNFFTVAIFPTAFLFVQNDGHSYGCWTVVSSDLINSSTSWRMPFKCQSFRSPQNLWTPLRLPYPTSDSFVSSHTCRTLWQWQPGSTHKRGCVFKICCRCLQPLLEMRRISHICNMMLVFNSVKPSLSPSGLLFPQISELPQFAL